ncbi:histidine kinase dimerization/phosphoacceptor domain -containing protein [Algoriphagus sp. AK58]|uniref:histidine kinase dimerization/phosphoacceptor domain -containing protein n=1 Tax=Algoriphagus sp. AK58 TaxID=1406877 RepID=UPI00164FCA94|nr:histidine kinase dimerization/phosphoacceptor domain -containing protein [Algoriphagus sp. AK58]
MNQCIKICFVFLGLFQLTNGYSQRSTWAKDSLAYYEKIFWSQIKAQKHLDARNTIKDIVNNASEDLDPMVFDFLKVTLKKSKEIRDADVLGNLEMGLGTLEYYRGDITAAKEAFKRAKTIYSNAKMLNEKAGMAMNIGVMQEKGGFYDSAILNYQEALPIFQQEKDTLSMASVNENIGLAFVKRSQYQKALEFFTKADSLIATYLDSLENRWIGLYINTNLAWIGLNRQDEALKVLLKALRVAEHNKNKVAIGKINYRLAGIYEFLGDDQKRYKALMTSKTNFKDNQNLLDIANLNSYLLEYHFDSKDLDSAVVYAQKCLEFYEPNGFTLDAGIIYGMLGNVEMEKENHKEAIGYFKRALDNFGDENPQESAGYLFNIGIAFNKIGDYKSALEFIERSLAIRKNLNIPADLQESYQGLAETYQLMGNYQKAFENLTLYQAYKDSVFNETKNKQLAELETQYETEKKDKAIADLEQEKELQNLRSEKQQAQIYLSVGGLVILFGIAGLFFRQSTIRKKYNDELETKNGEIAKQSAERELLLKEIHHRVKNNLQIISSLLSMQTRGLKDDKMKDAMKESQSRVKTMALIHEKLYQYENLSKINMQEYIQQLSDFLTQTYRSDKDIKITIEATDVNLDMDMAIPLGLITNELLSNSLKYAFEEQNHGEIIIHFTQKLPGSYSLLIKDSGKGLSENLDIENAKSLGLKLVKTLTRQINGKLKIVPQPGASFEIDFSDQPIAA